MKLSFKNPSVSGDFDISDELADFFLWWAQHRQDKRVESLLILLAEYDRETDKDEKRNIRRTVDELLENESLSLT